MEPIVEQVRQNMERVLGVLRTDLATIRTGRAAPSLVENIIVSVYGGSTKLRVMELATIVTTDPHTLVITPFDQTIINELQKGILEANIGLTPFIDGLLIRISIPPLSQERRNELIKLMQQKLENGRIMIRQARHDGMNVIKKQFVDKTISEDDKTRLEKEIQNVTDEFIATIDAMGKKKEEELRVL